MQKPVERMVKINLSDEECKDLAALAGKKGVTVSELLQYFISDLTDSARSNGSDEREFARQYYDRCFNVPFPEIENTLLKYLLDYNYSPEEYLDIWDNIKTAQEEKEYLRDHPEEANEEAEYLDDDIAMWQEKLADITNDWKTGFEPDMSVEIKALRTWVKNKEQFLGEESGTKKSNETCNRLGVMRAGGGSWWKEEKRSWTMGQKVGEVLSHVSTDDMAEYFKEHITGGESLLRNYMEEQILADEIRRDKQPREYER